MRKKLVVVQLVVISLLFASLGLCATEIGSRKNVELTVYNQDFALIKEQRSLVLKQGINQLSLQEVAAQIDPTSVHFKSLTDPLGTFVIEQNYDYDLVNTNKLMEKYVGKDIQLERTIDNKRDIVDATLLSTGMLKYPRSQQRNYGYYNQYYSSGGQVMKIGDKIFINPAGTLILPKLSEGLILKPTLDWTISAKKEGEHSTELSYITNGITWNADYVLVTNKEEKALDLTGWVTLDNRSGAAYNNAKLKLMAGDINLVRPAQTVYAEASRAMFASSGDIMRQPQFQEKQFSDYHLYTLQRPATINDNQTKQIEFTNGANVPFTKIYAYDGFQSDSRWQGYDSYSLRQQPDYGTKSNKKVYVLLEFVNSEKNHLGMPLPAGKVRVYHVDNDGSQEFVGEDQIEHTPKDEKIRVYTGNAFDIVGERKQTNFKVLVSGHSVEESFEIKVRNHKKEDVDVNVVEHLYRWSEWEITQKSMDFNKKDARTIEFPTHIPKDGEVVITYTVRYTW